MKTAASLLDEYTVTIPRADSLPLILTDPARRPFEDLEEPSDLKVLAPIDFSHGAASAAECAIDFARATGAHLTLLHVTDLNSPRSEWPAKAFDEAAPDDVCRITARGDVARTICGVAEHFDSDMILMNSGKRGRWRPFGKESVTGNVLDSTSRPVLITGSPEADLRIHSRRILCVLNLDGTDESAITRAEALAHRTGGELILVSAVPEASEELLYEALSCPSRPLSTSLAIERVNEIGKRLSVPYKTWVSTHSPHRCVDLAAREQSPDLVVASRGTLNIWEIGRRVRRPILSVAKSDPVRSRSVRGRTAFLSSQLTLNNLRKGPFYEYRN